MAPDVINIILEVIEERERKRRELLEEQRSAEEEQFAREGATLDEICDTSDLSPEQVRAAMKGNAERFMHCRMPDPDEAERDRIVYRMRRNQEEQPGWSPGVDF